MRGMWGGQMSHAVTQTKHRQVIQNEANGERTTGKHQEDNGENGEETTGKPSKGQRGNAQTDNGANSQSDNEENRAGATEKRTKTERGKLPKDTRNTATLLLPRGFPMPYQ